ncbi:hypothetical protein [Mycobacterium aquaticum]|uniref:Uncharacterized protein n=1 Tax=Mycobacterium aquaticum TaxID=1927124 RepID=A0A1W9ZUA7_9MYCO|nr:hypothetical protein [Mycobacterium aquaticum]ORA21245.1 hypothetical protein BST13_37885 [Mycobacterium aquaticum]
MLDDDGHQLVSERIAHTVDGLVALVAMITSLTGSVSIAIERAEGLLVEHLQQHCDTEIYCVSPRSRRGPANGIGWQPRSPTSSTPMSWPTHCATSMPSGGR